MKLSLSNNFLDNSRCCDSLIRSSINLLTCVDCYDGFNWVQYLSLTRIIGLLPNKLNTKILPVCKISLQYRHISFYSYASEYNDCLFQRRDHEMIFKATRLPPESRPTVCLPVACGVISRCVFDTPYRGCKSDRQIKRVGKSN